MGLTIASISTGSTLMPIFSSLSLKALVNKAESAKGFSSETISMLDISLGDASESDLDLTTTARL